MRRLDRDCSVFGKSFSLDKTVCLKLVRLRSKVSLCNIANGSFNDRYKIFLDYIYTYSLDRNYGLNI